MKKTSFISALSIGVLSISMAFAAPADAVNQIRENSVQVLKILNSGDANTARQKAEAYAIPYFDFQRMTALAVGNPWRTATDAQKQALTKEFQTLLIRTYSGTMLKFKNAKVNIKDNPVVNKGGKEIVVRAEINVSGQKPVTWTSPPTKAAANTAHTMSQSKAQAWLPYTATNLAKPSRPKASMA